MWKKLLILVAHLLFLFSFLFSFLSAGASDASKIGVVIDDAASREVIFAAKELCFYLEKITGQEHRLYKASDVRKKNEPVIYAGLSEEIKDIDISKCNPDGYILKTLKDNNIVIAGGSDIGTVFGIYGFLQDHCGMRFFLPGPHGTYIPQDKPLKIPSLDSVNNPAFISRLFFVKTPYDNLWYEHNRMYERFYFHHNLGNLTKPSEYGKDHPEYFPYVKDKHVVPKDDAMRGWQPCMSNPEVIKIVSDKVIDYFQKNPEKVCFSLGVNDNGGFCQCKNCLEINGPLKHNSQGVNDFSRVAFTFYNQIAENLSKVYPDKYIGIYAYSFICDLPEGFKLHPNIMVTRVNSFLPFFCKEYRKDFQRILDMANSSKFFGTSCYFYGQGYLIPVTPFKILEDYIDELYKSNARIWKSETFPFWTVDGIKCYVLARKLWDPSLRYTDLLKDFTEKMFGKGSGDMMAFYELCREKWETQKDVLPSKYHIWEYSARQLVLFDSQTCEKLLQYLKNARRLATYPDGQALLDEQITYYTFLHDLSVFSVEYRKPSPAGLPQFADRCIELENMRIAIQAQLNIIRKMITIRDAFDLDKMCSAYAIACPLLEACEKAGDMTPWRKFVAALGNSPEIQWFDQNRAAIASAPDLLGGKDILVGKDKWQHAKWWNSAGCRMEEKVINGTKWACLDGFKSSFVYTPLQGFQYPVELFKDKRYMLSFDYFQENMTCDPFIVLPWTERTTSWSPFLTNIPKRGVVTFTPYVTAKRSIFLGANGLDKCYYSNVSMKEIPDFKAAIPSFIIPDMKEIPVLPEPLTVSLPADFSKYDSKIDDYVAQPHFLKLRYDDPANGSLRANITYLGRYDLKVKVTASGESMSVTLSEGNIWKSNGSPAKVILQTSLTDNPKTLEFGIPFSSSPNINMLIMRFAGKKDQKPLTIHRLEFIPEKPAVPN